MPTPDVQYATCAHLALELQDTVRRAGAARKDFHVETDSGDANVGSRGVPTSWFDAPLRCNRVRVRVLVDDRDAWSDLLTLQSCDAGCPKGGGEKCRLSRQAERDNRRIQVAPQLAAAEPSCFLVSVPKC